MSDVTVAYDDRPVLDRVFLAVEAGDFLGLVGPNGSEKTTLFELTVGSFLIHREMAMIADTLAHGAFAGVAAGLFVTATFSIVIVAVLVFVVAKTVARARHCVVRSRGSPRTGGAVSKALDPDCPADG